MEIPFVSPVTILRQPTFDPALLDRIREEGKRWEFGQSWSEQSSPQFAPGCVTIARQEDTLLILAELKDENVIDTVFPFNYPAFKEADAFEIFIRNFQASYYHEFHITPSNSCLQLRFEVDQPHQSLEHHFVWNPLFASCVRIVEGGWQVLVEIVPENLSLSGSLDWQISFGRYDYKNGDMAPVISSTSLHSVMDFHRLAEWSTINLGNVSKI